METPAIAYVMDLPHEVHLSAGLQNFSCTKSKHNGIAEFDTAELEIDQVQFPTEDWHENLYCSCKEDL